MYISNKIIKNKDAIDTEDCINLLILNSERYEADLEVLQAHQYVNLFLLPSNIQHLVNAIWVSDIRNQTIEDPDAYLCNKSKEIIKARDSLKRFLIVFLEKLNRTIEFDALVTCTFYYRQDREWELACSDLFIPFFVLHKENMKDDAIYETYVNRYRERRYKFSGNKSRKRNIHSCISSRLGVLSNDAHAANHN